MAISSQPSESRSPACAETPTAEFLVASPRLGRRKIGLPLPSTVELDWIEESSNVKPEAYRICDALEAIIELLLQYLPSIQENLFFWQSKAKGSNVQKAYFMICQHGPPAFLDGICGFVCDVSRMQKVCLAADSHISQRIKIFSSLRYFLATFLAKIYTELDARIVDLVRHPENSIPRFLPTINNLFMELEASVNRLHSNDVDGTNSCRLRLEIIPECNMEPQFNDTISINVIYGNLHALNTYLSIMVSKHCKPERFALYWIPYGCGAFAISFSLWILYRSKLMGSHDLHNSIHDHVKRTIPAIRDGRAERFRKRQEEREEVQRPAASLHRMLLAFSEKETGRTPSEGTSDMEMMERVMRSNEKVIQRPVWGLLSGRLFDGLRIQAQEIKLDAQETMVILGVIKRINKIISVILAALSSFAITIPLGTLVHTVLRRWLKLGKHGRGRLLLGEFKNAIAACKAYQDAQTRMLSACTVLH